MLVNNQLLIGKTEDKKELVILTVGEAIVGELKYPYAHLI